MKIHSIIRRILELAAPNIVFVRRINVRGGAVLRWKITADSQLKYLKKTFDDELRTFIEQHLDQDEKVRDLGANCGTFSAFRQSSGKPSRILAIGADMKLSNIPLDNARKHDFDILSCAIANCHCFEGFEISKRGRATSSLSVVKKRQEKGGIKYYKTVSCTSIDFLVQQTFVPTFVKIDKEGAELIAIRGSKNLIEKRKVEFKNEIEEKYRKEIINIFAKHDYEMKEVFPDNYFLKPR